MDWRKLKFELFSYKDPNNSKYSKEYLDDNEDIQESECDKCTYKIEKNEYKKCQYCSIIYHKACIEFSEGSANTKKKFNPESNTTTINEEPYSCNSCKNCLNCKTSDNKTKIFCTVCNNCYHEGCIHDIVKSTNQLKDPYVNWKCENCAECSHCEKSIKKYDKPEKINFR